MSSFDSKGLTTTYSSGSSGKGIVEMITSYSLFGTRPTSNREAFRRLMISGISFLIRVARILEEPIPLEQTTMAR